MRRRTVVARLQQASVQRARRPPAARRRGPGAARRRDRGHRRRRRQRPAGAGRDCCSACMRLSGGRLELQGQRMPARPRRLGARRRRPHPRRPACGGRGRRPAGVGERGAGARWRRPPSRAPASSSAAAAQAHARQLIERFDVRGTDAMGLDTPTRALSGGNMQKLILGRALVGDPGSDKPPTLIVADQPTWGLDIGAVAYVHQQLLDACARRRGGAADQRGPGRDLRPGRPRGGACTTAASARPGPRPIGRWPTSAWRWRVRRARHAH